MVYLHFVIVACFLVAQSRCKEKRDTYGNYNSNYQSYNYQDPSQLPVDCKAPPSCLTVSQIPNQGIDDVDLSWVQETRLFYQPLTTCYGYELSAKICLGRDPFSMRELQEMCLSTFFGKSAGYTTTYSCYGYQYYQNCAPNPAGNRYAATCNNTFGDSGTDPSVQIGEDDYPVATDGEYWILYYRCIDGRYGDVLLLDTRPYIERSDLTKVMGLIKKYFPAFQSSDILLLPCYFPTYPVPYQTYPLEDPALSKSCYNTPPYGAQPATSKPASYNPAHPAPYQHQPYH